MVISHKKLGHVHAVDQRSRRMLADAWSYEHGQFIGSLPIVSEGDKYVHIPTIQDWGSDSVNTCSAHHRACRSKGSKDRNSITGMYLTRGQNMLVDVSSKIQLAHESTRIVHHIQVTNYHQETSQPIHHKVCTPCCLGWTAMKLDSVRPFVQNFIIRWIAIREALVGITCPVSS